MNLFSQAVEQLRLLATWIPGLQTLAAAPYFFRPLLLVVALGVVCALVGVLVNLRCAEFSAEALVHAVFPGIVVGAVFGGLDMIIPAAGATAILAASVLTWLTHRASQRAAHRSASEAGTAVLLTGFFSVGIIISLAKGDRSGQLEALMFGRLLEITDLRLAQALAVCLLALVLVAVAWKEQIFYAFDPTGARAQGLNLLTLDLLLNAAVAAVVVSASTAVGTLLVIGYLVLPGAAGRVLARSVRGMVTLALTLGVGGGYLGLMLMLLPAPRPVSPQASVALTMIALFFLAVIIGLLRNRLGDRGAQNGAPCAALRRGAA